MILLLLPNILDYSMDHHSQLDRIFGIIITLLLSSLLKTTWLAVDLLGTLALWTLCDSPLVNPVYVSTQGRIERRYNP
jgi:hypothetical protein